jgi:F-type H+-transporting ATPase subunit h
LYLKEISAFKPTPVKPSDADGHVTPFAIPKAPTSPEEANIANELKDYEAQQPDIEGSAADGTAPAVEDWFEEEEDDAPSGGH